MRDFTRVEITFMFTALPYGLVEGNKLKLSILVSPVINAGEINKLGNISDFLDTILSAYNDPFDHPSENVKVLIGALLDWPTVLNQLDLRIRFANHVVDVGSYIIRKAKSTYWKLIFNKDMFVKPYRSENHTGQSIGYYNTMEVLEVLKEVFGAIDLESLGDTTSVLQKLQQISSEKRQESRSGQRTQSDTSVEAIARFERFHNPQKAEVIEPTKDDDKPSSYTDNSSVIDDRNIIDFHDVVSYVSSYPTIMEILGLKVDIEFPIDLTIIDRVGPMSVEVWNLPKKPLVIEAGGYGPTYELMISSVSPRVEYEIKDVGDNTLFYSPQQTDLGYFDNGMLVVADTSSIHPQPIQTDVDSAALKIIGIADEIAVENKDIIERKLAEILPDMTSGDIGLAWKEPAERIANQLERVRSLIEDIAKHPDPSTGRATTFQGDDLIMGLRVDVFDESTKKWYSLCERNERYFLFGNPDEALPTIGYPSEGSYPDEGVISEAIGTTQQPHKRDIDPSTFSEMDEIEGAWWNGPEQGEDSIIESLDPGIANEPTHDCMTEEGGELESCTLYVSDMIFRWNGWGLCIPMPNVVDTGTNKGSILQAVFTPKTYSLPRLRFGRTYRFRVRTVDAAGNGLTLEEANLLGASLHETKEITFKRFEPLPPPNIIPSLAVPVHKDFLESNNHLIIRSNRDISAKDFSINDEDIFIKQKAGIDMRFVAPQRVSQQFAERHGAFDNENGYVSFDYNLIQNADYFGGVDPSNPETPYLPDPLSKSIIFKGEANTPISINYSDDYQGIWPRITPIRLIATEGELETIVPNQNYKEVTITIPKAHTTKLTVSSSFDDASYLELLGIWEWLEHNDGRDSEAALNGNYSFLTPSSELTITHAVQQPLKFATPNPNFKNMAVEPRERGHSWISFDETTLEYHTKSTESVEVVAEWEEWVDDLQKEGPELVVQFDRLAYIQLTESSKSEQKIKLFQQFSNTNYRSINYSTVALSRFKRYFPDDGRSFTLRHTETRDIKSTLQPVPPTIAYMVPAFRWTESIIHNDHTRKREGGWIRVFIKRPWFSSGNGEKLAIIISNAGDSLEVNKMSPPTEWGADPISNAVGLDTQQRSLSHESFKNVHKHDWITVQDDIKDPQTGSKIEAVLYEPQYDRGKRLWFVDIQIAPLGITYSPFIRFSFARFQKQSLAGLELSEIISTDFIQLSNDREASIIFRPARRELSLSLTGPIRQTAKNIPGNKVHILAYSEEDIWKWDDDGYMEKGVFTTEIDMVPNDRSIIIELREYEQMKDATGKIISRLVYADKLIIRSANNPI